MATRTITTSIALDGEQKFKQQMGEVNRELRNLNSEMGLVEETFRGQANTTEALTAKGEILRREIEQQEEKVRALEGALEESTEAFGESSAKTDSYRQSLNRAQTDLLKLNRELEDNERYLDEAKRSADDCASSIDEFGREVRDVDLGGMGGSSGIGGLISNLGSLKNMLVGGAIVGGVKELSGAVLGIVNDTAEYRKIMGTLETSSEAAGYSAEETAETYDRLYSVLGDTQAAATATANLQALGLGQENVRKMTDLAIGAWATYGDSIPIDGLAEAINETIQAGQVTGSFADVLNWAGISEDEFNTKLQESATFGDRANLVMKTLSDEGLAKTAEGWFENNEDLVKLNEAQGKWEESMGKLGEVLSPAATALTNFGADAIVVVTEMITGLSDAVEKAWGWWDKLVKTMTENKIPENAVPAGRLGTIHGSHKLGLDYVPFDGYTAQLHEGERILTAEENRVFTSMGIDRAPRAGLSAAEMQQITAAAVNALLAQGSGNAGDLVVRVAVGDAELATAILPAFRRVSKSNPEATNDE